MSYNPSSLVSKIATSTDVSLTVPLSGQVLTYNANSSKWVNSQPGSIQQIIIRVSEATDTLVSANDVMSDPFRIYDGPRAVTGLRVSAPNAGAGLSVRFMASGATYGSLTTDTDGRASLTFSEPFSLPLDTTARIDYTAVPTNVTGPVTLTLLTDNRVPGKPVPGLGYDLVVTDISFGKSIVSVSDAITFKAIIRNQGATAIAAGTIIGCGFSIDGTLFNYADSYAGGLAAGSSVTVSASGSYPGGANPWVATSGTHIITAVVDDINRLPNEVSENNNSYSISLLVA